MHYDANFVIDNATELDEGWKRTVVDLAPGDTADPGCSTKWFYLGPGEVEYLVHATGWIVRPDESVTRTYTRSR